MAKEYEDFVEEYEYEQVGSPTTWQEAIQRCLEPVLQLGAFRHVNYGVGNILDLGQEGVAGEIGNKVARMKENFRIQTTIKTLERFGLPVPEVLTQEIASEKFTDAAADIINYAIYILMLSRKTGDGELYWTLPMEVGGTQINTTSFENTPLASGVPSMSGNVEHSVVYGGGVSSENGPGNRYFPDIRGNN